MLRVRHISRSSAAAVSALLLLIYIVGVPFHLTENHHHASPPSDGQYWYYHGHEHHHHAVSDHDYDGIRGQHSQLHFIPAETGIRLYAPIPCSFVTVADLGQCTPHDGSGQESLRAPPLA